MALALNNPWKLICYLTKKLNQTKKKKKKFFVSNMATSLGSYEYKKIYLTVQSSSNEGFAGFPGFL